MAKNNLLCLSSISLSDPIIEKNTARAEIIVTESDGTESCFEIINKYEHELRDTSSAVAATRVLHAVAQLWSLLKKNPIEFSNKQSRSFVTE